MSTPSSAGDRLVAFVRARYLTLDTRWLGVFRVCLGALLMVEVLRRWYYAPAFYTNDGLLPNHYSLYAPMGRNVFSIYHAFSTYGEVSVAFFVTLLVFLTFTLGYRTKLFHALSAFCITSLNARNLFIENGGTVVVNILTVYTLFLPLGQHLSLDAVRRARSPRAAARPEPPSSSTSVTSLAVLLLLVQWSAIYFLNTVQKDGEGWRNGSALYWFFQQDRIVTSLGIWTRNHVPFGALRVLTYGALCVEGTLSVLILFPFFQKWTRRAILVLVWGLHGMIALSARIGPFSYAMMLFPVLLLGAEDWELVTRPFRSERWLRRRQALLALPSIQGTIARLQRFPTDLRNALGSVREGLVVVLGVAALAAIAEQNVFFSRQVHVHRSDWMVKLIDYPRLLQGWSMFAPEPPYEDGRVVVDGRTADGRRFDPFSNGVPSFDPEAPEGWGHSQFWCDYHNRIRFGDNAHHRQYLRAYLLHQHELSGHPENRLVAFDVWWVQDRSPEPGKSHGEPLPPEKLLSYGNLTDSGAAPWLGPLQAKQRGRRDAPLHGP
jgi:hypothetical protein